MIALPAGAEEALQVQHLDALCAEITSRLEASLAERFATAAALTAHTERAATDSEEIRTFANNLLEASRVDAVKAHDELRAQIVSLQEVIQQTISEAVASETGSTLQGISAALESTIAQNDAGWRAQISHAKVEQQDAVRKEIRRLEDLIGATTARTGATVPGTELSRSW